MMFTKDDKGSFVSAAARTMGILEALGKSGLLTLGEVAERCGLHKSTAFRFVGTLLRLGYVFHDTSTDRYGLSLKLNALAGIGSGSQDILYYASSPLENLSRKTGETIHLAVLDNGNLVYLRKIESKRALRVVTMASSVGGSVPLYCTGLGKAILAWLPLIEQERYIAHQIFTRFTETTITDGPSLLTGLAQIKAQGFSIDREEHEKGVVCVAAPIFTSGRMPLGAVSIAGPSVRMGEKEIEQYTGFILEAAGEISGKLGYIGVD